MIPLICRVSTMLLRHTQLQRNWTKGGINAMVDKIIMLLIAFDLLLVALKLLKL